MKFPLLLFLLSAMMAFGQTDPSANKVTLDDVAEALAKSQVKAVDGDLESCLEIWRGGRFIDKHEILKSKYPLERRLATTRNHDVSDRLDGVTNAYGSQTQSFGVTEFDNMNRRKKIEREDCKRWAYGYNSKGEVTSGLREKTASPNAPVPGWQHGYTFDEIGNRLTATANARVSTYVPNALNQYDSRTIPRTFDVIGKANTAASVTVDGNPATRLDEFFYKELAAGSGAIHTPYVVQATDANGTTTRSGGKFLPATPEAFTYDFDGNLTSDGRFTCTWDAENRLVAMETHPTVPLAARRKLVFAYDAMHRRIKKDVWHGTASGGWQLRHKFDFIHELNGWNILAERSGGSANSLIRTYAWGTDLSGNLSGAGGVGGLLFATLHTSGKTFAYGADLNGNVTLLVDTATGQSAATYDYGPFGELLRQSGEYAMLNPYRFSTKYMDDETGLLDFGYRPYDPRNGRFLSKDPRNELGFLATSKGDFLRHSKRNALSGENLYAFAINNSLNKWELLGLEWHHLLPRGIFDKEFLRRENIKDLDIDNKKYGWDLDITVHRGKGQSVHSRGWNPEWRNWIAAEKAAGRKITKCSIEAQLEVMKNNYSDLLSKGKAVSGNYRKVNYKINKGTGAASVVLLFTLAAGEYTGANTAFAEGLQADMEAWYAESDEWQRLIKAAQISDKAGSFFGIPGSIILGAFVDKDGNFY